MEQRAGAINLAAQHLEGQSPLQRFLIALYESGEASRLVSHIAFLAHKAGPTGAQPAQELAQEIFHDVIVEVLRKQESFDPARNGRAWLLGFANNLIKRRRQSLFDLNKRERVASDLQGGAQAEAEPLNEVEILERLYALRAAQGGDSSLGAPAPEQVVVGALSVEALLAPLAPEDRRLVELSVLEGMKGAEVARELGISEGNGRVRLFRIMKKLRMLVREAGMDDRDMTDRDVTGGDMNSGDVISGEKHSHES